MGNVTEGKMLCIQISPIVEMTVRF